MESVNQYTPSETKGSKSASDLSRFGRIRAKLAGGYNHGVRDGYCYGLKEPEGFISNVEIEHGQVQLPSVNDEGHTAFLKVHVRASCMGRLVLPSVKIDSDEGTEIQYFERGCRGIRYINISSFVEGGASQLRLQGKHVTLDKQAELVCFNNEIPREPTVLVISPHPDDAEIAAFGFYSDFKNTSILTITAGDTGTYNYDRIYSDRAEHYLKKGELRTWNSIAVPMLCGIPPEQVLNLGFFEDRLKEMFHEQGKDFCGLYHGVSDINTFRKQNLSSLAAELDGTANWNSLITNLTRLLKRIRPDIIITPHPVLDVQDDHRYSSIAVFEAVKRAELHNGRFYLYTNHIPFNHLYPYGRMGSLVALPPSFDRSPYYTSIYSHQLSAKKQKDKMFALEAMNDLRLNTHRTFSSGATLTALKAPFKDLLGYDDSYYRRAVRRNELFFVVDIKDLYDDEKRSRLEGPHEQDVDNAVSSRPQVIHSKQWH